MTRNQNVLWEYIQEKTSVQTIQSWVTTKTAKKLKPRRKCAGVRSHLSSWKVRLILQSSLPPSLPYWPLCPVLSEGEQGGQPGRDEGGQQGEDHAGAGRDLQTGGDGRPDQLVPPPEPGGGQPLLSPGGGEGAPDRRGGGQCGAVCQD